MCDLDFADDIALIADSWSNIQQTTTALTMEASKVGLCIYPDVTACVCDIVDFILCLQLAFDRLDHHCM